MLQAFSISNGILPFGSPFLALFSLVPMYFAFYGAKTYRRSFLIFFVETLTVHIFSSSWLANFHGFAVFTLGASALGTGLLGGIVGLVLHFFPDRLQKISPLEENSGRRLFFMPARIIWFSASWVFWEWIKSTGLLAYPWGTVSMAAYRWKIFTQIADITGVWGITFLFTLFSGVLAEGLHLFMVIRHSQNPAPMVLNFRSCAKFMCIMFAVSGAYGIFQYIAPRNVTKQMETVIVQQNVDPWEAGDLKSISISAGLTEKKLEEMSAEGRKPDLVLWSEGTLNQLFPGSIEYYSVFPGEESLTEFIGRMDVPFIIGGTALVDPYKKKYTNVSVLFDREGSYAGFYSKMHLVPFAELIPLSDNPLMSWFMKNVVGMPASMAEGKQGVIFKIPLMNNTVRGTVAPLEYQMEPYATIELDNDGLADLEKAERYIRNPERNPDASVSFSTPICFEDAFPDVCRKLFNQGSEIFLNITNDSWSKTAYAEYQHFIAASYLSIEFRTTLVRCCNSGYSAVIGPNGKILASLDVFKTDALDVMIPVYEHKPTVFSRYGDWFAYTIIALMALYFIVETTRFRTGGKIPKIKISIIRDAQPKDTVDSEDESETGHVYHDVKKDSEEKSSAEIHAPKTPATPLTTSTAYIRTDLFKPQETVKTPEPKTTALIRLTKAAEPEKEKTTGSAKTTRTRAIKAAESVKEKAAGTAKTTRARSTKAAESAKEKAAGTAKTTRTRSTKAAESAKEKTTGSTKTTRAKSTKAAES
ncbi:MAG: apolipoprotein N-acyltransferase, partial [Treponema sp.]|nr:apolipoprotein N-acyltransferase [Treponema sp.]